MLFMLAVSIPAWGATNIDLLHWFVVQMTVSDIGIAYGQLDRFDAERVEEVFSMDGQTVQLDVKLSVGGAAELSSALADASSGRIECREQSG